MRPKGREALRVTRNRRTCCRRERSTSFAEEHKGWGGRVKDHRLQPKTANGLTERTDGTAACALRYAQLVHNTFGVGIRLAGAQPSVRRQASLHAK